MNQDKALTHLKFDTMNKSERRWPAELGEMHTIKSKIINASNSKWPKSLYLFLSLRKCSVHDCFVSQSNADINNHLNVSTVWGNKSEFGMFAPNVKFKLAIFGCNGNGNNNTNSRNTHTHTHTPLRTNSNCNQTRYN